MVFVVKNKGKENPAEWILTQTQLVTDNLKIFYRVTFDDDDDLDFFRVMESILQNMKPTRRKIMFSNRMCYSNINFTPINRSFFWVGLRKVEQLWRFLEDLL